MFGRIIKNRTILIGDSSISLKCHHPFSASNSCQIRPFVLSDKSNANGRYVPITLFLKNLSFSVTDFVFLAANLVRESVAGWSIAVFDLYDVTFSSEKQISDPSLFRLSARLLQYSPRGD